MQHARWGLALLLPLFTVPVGCAPKKPLAEACRKDSECETKSCLAVGKERVCTKECKSDTSCGPGLSCYVTGRSDYGYCAKADEAARKLFETCDRSDECSHRICMKTLTAAAGQGYCSKMCESDGDCIGGTCAKPITGAARMCQKK